MYEIEFSRKAAKFYQKVDTTIAGRLNAALSILAEDPFSHYSIERLSGELKSKGQGQLSLLWRFSVKSRWH